MNNKSGYLLIIIFVLMICSMLWFMPEELVKAVDFMEESSVLVHCQYYNGNLPVINNGAGKIVTMPTEQFDEQSKFFVGVKGVDIKFSADSLSSVHTLINQLDIFVYDSQQMGEVFVLYGYSHKVKSGILIDGKEVNVQIAYNQGVVTVGSPIILGSF